MIVLGGYFVSAQVNWSYHEYFPFISGTIESMQAPLSNTLFLIAVPQHFQFSSELPGPCGWCCSHTDCLNKETGQQKIKLNFLVAMFSSFAKLKQAKG